MTVEKKVDESWKEQVERERRLAEAQAAKPKPPGQGQGLSPPAGQAGTKAGESLTSEGGGPAGNPGFPAEMTGKPAEEIPAVEGTVPSDLDATGLPEPSFAVFLSSLSMQAMIALGELPIPGTTQRREDLEQARYLIDTLGLLQQKTQGNLTAEESQFLENALYELRVRYTQKLQASIPPPPGEPRR